MCRLCDEDAMYGHLGDTCAICKQIMDVPGNESTRNCGGDCLRCMALCGDPDCEAVMQRLEPGVPWVCD